MVALASINGCQQGMPHAAIPGAAVRIDGTTLTPSINASAEAVVDDDCADQPAEVYGRLEAREEFGPPGWGETPPMDARWTLYILKLEPASVKMIAGMYGPCLDEPVHAAALQVLSHDPATRLSPHVGRNVRVSGNIHPDDGAPSQLMGLLLVVDSIDPR